MTAGATPSIHVAQGPAQTTDWVGLFAVGAADSARLDWKYLNGTQSAPSSGVSGATFTMAMPSTPGSYEFRFFTGTSTKLATSGTVVMPGAPTITVNGVAPPAGATVATGSTLTVALANGSGSATDWVALAPAGAANTNYLSWQYLNGTSSPPLTGLTNAMLTFTAPASIGSYELRWFANNSFTRVATAYVSTANPTVTVSMTNPSGGATFVHPSSVTLSASTTVSGGTIDHVSFYAGATLVGTTTTSPYSVAWSNPSGGPYALTAAATDNVGHITTSSAVNISVTNGTLDTPTSSPAPGIFAANQIVTLSGPTGATIRYTTDGSTPSASSAVYGGALTLNATTTVKAMAFQTDWSPSTVMSATYQIDSTGPAITAWKLPEPNPAGWNHGPVTVSFTCTDALAGVQSCPQPVVFDQEGANQQVTVHAQDTVGNDTASTVTINIDKTAPTLTLSAPANPTTTTDSTVSMTASVSDALSGTASATCNGTSATISSGSVSCTANLRPGVNVLVMQLSDAAGNSVSGSALVTRTAVTSALAVVPATRGLSVGDTAALRVLEDSGLAAQTATWASSDTNVATVQSDGTVTAVAAGTATITATQNSLSAQASVTVSSGALAVGATRWAIDPSPNVSGSLMVGVSGIDGTRLATVESIADGAIVRGFTTDGEPTWTFNVPLASSESVTRVMGDVFGGVLALTNTASIVRVDPTGASSWRLKPHEGVEEWAQAPDGTLFIESWDAVTALDGGTGQMKFAIDSPPSIRGCTGYSAFEPETLGFSGLKVDASGRAVFTASTRWWDQCYTSDSAINAIIDVILYRVGSSGSTETVPVNHHEYAYYELRTPPGGWNPNPIATTMPGDNAGTLVWWSPSFEENPSLARAAYVSDTGTVGTDYALLRPPSLSAAGQIGYVNLPATNSWYDRVTVSIEKMNLTTGEAAWSAPTDGHSASVLLDEGLLARAVVNGVTSLVKIGPDGSVEPAVGGIGETSVFMGEAEIRASTSNGIVAAVADTADVVGVGFAFSSDNSILGDEQQQVRPRQPQITTFLPQSPLGPQYSAEQFANDMADQTRGVLKASTFFFRAASATAERYLAEVKDRNNTAVAFVGHSALPPHEWASVGSVGLLFDDKSIIKRNDPQFTDYRDHPIPPDTSIPHTIVVGSIDSTVKILFVASCDPGEIFNTLWDIDDNTEGRVLIRPVGTAITEVDLLWSARGWLRIATLLSNGGSLRDEQNNLPEGGGTANNPKPGWSVAQAVDWVNTHFLAFAKDENGNPITLSFTVIGKHQGSDIFLR